MCFLSSITLNWLYNGNCNDLLRAWENIHEFMESFNVEI